jgi:hypothetical protein
MSVPEARRVHQQMTPLSLAFQFERDLRRAVLVALLLLFGERIPPLADRLAHRRHARLALVGRRNLLLHRRPHLAGEQEVGGGAARRHRGDRFSGRRVGRCGQRGGCRAFFRI